MLLRRAVLLGLSLLAFAHVARAFAVTRLSAWLAPTRVSLLCARATARLRLRGVTRALSLRAAAELTPDMSDVLKRYGVPAADHAALVAELAPLLVGQKASAARVETLDVTLQRGPEGGLSLRVPMCLAPSCTTFFCLSQTLALSLLSHCVSVSLSCFSLPVFLSPPLSLTHSTTLSLPHCLAISVYFFLSPFHLSPLFLSLPPSNSLSLSFSFSLSLSPSPLAPSLPPSVPLPLSLRAGHRRGQEQHHPGQQRAEGAAGGRQGRRDRRRAPREQVRGAGALLESPLYSGLKQINNKNKIKFVSQALF